jgi:hypothetical protein
MALVSSRKIDATPGAPRQATGNNGRTLKADPVSRQSGGQHMARHLLLIRVSLFLRRILMRKQMPILAVLPFALFMTACDVDVEEQGELPSVDVEGEPG